MIGLWVTLALAADIEVPADAPTLADAIALAAPGDRVLLATGRHEAGTFFAAASFMQQCSTALGLVANGLILTWSAFPAKVSADQVTDAMMDSLVIHYLFASFGLWLLGCVILLFYPITRAHHERNVEILKARLAEARAREADNFAGGPVR